MFLANMKSLPKVYAGFSIAEPKKNKNDQVRGNSELKLKTHFKVYFKPLSKIYAEFSIAEPKKIRMNK